MENLKKYSTEQLLGELFSRENEVTKIMQVEDEGMHIFCHIKDVNMSIPKGSLIIAVSNSHLLDKVLCER